MVAVWLLAGIGAMVCLLMAVGLFCTILKVIIEWTRRKA